MSEQPKKPQGPGLQNGMLVFFEECKKSAHRKAGKIRFRGHGFGVLLGVTPQFAKEPTRENLIALLGSTGFVLLDDVADFLGDESAKVFTEKFIAKYEQKTEPVIEEPQATLFGLDGEPLMRPIPIAARVDK